MWSSTGYPDLGSLKLGIAEVWLNLANLTELLLCVGGRHRRRNNNIIANLPVNWGGHALLVSSLQGIDHAQDLCGVTAGRSGVHHSQTDLLAGINNEDGADGERDTLLVNVVQVLLINHVVEESHLTIGISDDWELYVGR